MAKLSSTDLLAQFKEMTLVELSDFVKAFETEFDVTAAAPVAVAAAGGAAGGGEAAAAHLVDSAPATVLEKADKATADKAKAALEAAGAKVSIK